MGDFLYDHGPSFQAILNVLPRYETVLDEYQVLAKQTAALYISVQKLENQAQSDQSDEAVTRLSETYYQYQSIASQMQAKGSYVNYADTFLVSEMDHFHKVWKCCSISAIESYSHYNH
jgi:hypothetical protein